MGIGHGDICVDPRGLGRRLMLKAGRAAQNWRVMEMKTGHMAMMTEPERLAELLLAH